MARRIALREVDQLSAAEKILLAQDLWDSVAEDPEAWPLTAAQKMELARRDRALERDMKAGKPLGVSWSQAKRQVRRGKR
jgi:putative addiction module component (TIGR02574 family)